MHCFSTTLPQEDSVGEGTGMQRKTSIGINEAIIVIIIIIINTYTNNNNDNYYYLYIIIYAGTEVTRSSAIMMGRRRVE